LGSKNVAITSQDRRHLTAWCRLLFTLPSARHQLTLWDHRLEMGLMH